MGVELRASPGLCYASIVLGARAFSRFSLVAMVAIASACSVGEGEGFVRGSLHLEGCEADLSGYDMNPNFFGAQSVSGPGAGSSQLVIRIQRGADIQEYQDSLTISVIEVDDIRVNQLGKPIPIAAIRPPGSAPDVPPPKVRMSMSLRGSCGSPKLNPGDNSQVVLHATSGTIIFDSILDPNAPSRDTNAKRIEGHFENVQFEDPRKPMSSGGLNGGTLSGQFKFFYQRGGPAQPFP